MRTTIKPEDLQEGDMVYFAQDEPDEIPCRLSEILERSEWNVFCRFIDDGGRSFRGAIPFALTHIEIERRVDMSESDL